jgi:hypothetical protein
VRFVPNGAGPFTSDSLDSFNDAWFNMSDCTRLFLLLYLNALGRFIPRLLVSLRIRDNRFRIVRACSDDMGMVVRDSRFRYGPACSDSTGIRDSSFRNVPACSDRHLVECRRSSRIRLLIQQPALTGLQADLWGTVCALVLFRVAWEVDFVVQLRNVRDRGSIGLIVLLRKARSVCVIRIL